MWLGKEYKLCLQDKNEEVYNALNEHYSELYSAELIRDWPIFIEFRRTEFYNKFVEEHAEDFETTIIKITDNKNRVLADNADAVIDAGTDKVIFLHHAAGKNKSVEKRCIQYGNE